ncbi:Pc13g14530 [Penicillium rubens Wisconsin 54-1255]|uniref:Pc13g14530 protein n=1 Tax=Penicillium rubens (strain ATCC 28089 / DSM 1075 / NRRL 1951 / Wisconsin 54-1255) TaxID=500485 RepID=B6H2I9_PENRW|nr:Pc13g14530 [Penicillium rubens Wisconsin 54-1255]
MADTIIKDQPDYSAWSTSSLIARITELERQLHSQTTEFTASTDEPQTALSSAAPISTDVPEPAIPLPETFNTSKKRPHSPLDSDSTPVPAPSRVIKAAKPPKLDRSFDPSKYSTRFIALKFAYLGQAYNGLEHTNGNTTPLPTVEEVLWKALRRTRLISPETTSDLEPSDRAERVPMRPYHLYWDGCEYSKAGRTDKGVSAFGQVIGLRVRTDEMNYINVLNRVLPEDIRVLAWCPNPPPGFDARFSCRERRYKYFFTNPAFSPTPGSIGFQNRAQNGNGPRAEFREGWLDIEAMREAAKHFEGSHDFRNFCKLDTNKQIDNFERIIHHSISQSIPQVYSFNLHGSAFLWHQVRHMVAILFLVGQGLESPSIVPELLDVAKNPRKPTYAMADDAPLVLWDCIFPDVESGSRADSLNWIYAGDSPANGKGSAKGDSKFGMRGTVESLWAVWRKRKIDEMLAGALLDLTVTQGNQKAEDIDNQWQNVGYAKKSSRGAKVWSGGNDTSVGGKYVPVHEKPKMQPVEVQNAKGLITKQRRLAKGEAARAALE